MRVTPRHTKNPIRYSGIGLTFLAMTVALTLAAAACGRGAPATDLTPTTPTRVPTAKPTATPVPTPTSPFPTATPAPAVRRTPAPTGAATRIPTPTWPPTQPSLPTDEGPHGRAIEWWYFNGHLVDENGVEYTFHYVTFQRNTANGLAPQVLHVSFSDPSRQSYFIAEKLALAQTPTSPGSFSFQTEGWRMAGDGLDYILAFDLHDVSLLLRAVSRKPAVMHQTTGLVDLGPAGQSYYYSRTRLEAVGALVKGRDRREVRGTLWMDHQWGDFNTTPVGWDWVGLQLDDGSEVMVSVVWDQATKLPVASYGTYVAADGSVRHLEAHNVLLRSTDQWQSPTTEASYPMGWTLGMLPLSLAMTITPLRRDAEFTANTYIPAPYWEGAVTVRGTKNGVPVSGKGFVEMVGYAARKSGSAASGATQGR